MASKKCNICGKDFDIFDRQEDFQIKRGSKGIIGYGSIHDGEGCDCHLCIKCFDKLMASLRFQIDPFYIEDGDWNGQDEGQISLY